MRASNVIGVVPGKSDENIIINAHVDGWFDGANDNGDGSAVMVALAEHFSKPENRPARTLVFVGSAGHHTGGLNGPGQLVSQNRELIAKNVLAINLEHVAGASAQPGAHRHQRLARLHHRCGRELPDERLERTPAIPRSHHS